MSSSEHLFTVFPEESAEAFRNPFKGFRPTRFFGDTDFKYHPYACVYQHCIQYTDLEVEASDSVQKIIDWSNRAWAGIEERNIKVIPRVIIHYPNVGEYWPQGIPHGDPAWQWTTTELKERLVAFIAKIGQAWDNDPRVAYIAAGLWGHWGEHHVHPYQLDDGTSRIPLDFQKALGDAYQRAFKNKKVQVRNPVTFRDYEIGFIWDSFALVNDLDSGNGIVERDHWRTQINGGEIAYDWGDKHIQPGNDPNATLKYPHHRSYVIDWIKKTHTTSLGWVDLYDDSDPEVASGAAEMQKEFGYRFVMEEASFSKTVEPGGDLRVSLRVQNKGSAPFYEQWPLEVSLLRNDRTVAWTGELSADIRQWMPGEEWDSETRRYLKTAPVQSVSGLFTLPSDLEKGTYTLAISILDPAGNLPAVRFANANYYKGGRHPIGKIGIGQQPSDQDLGTFDRLKEDNKLYYSKVKK